MGVKLVSASGGSVELVAPATATNYTQTLPANTGTVITTASTFAGTGPAFSAYQGGAQQSISANTSTVVSFDTETFDTNANYSTSTYRFTPTVAGYYLLTATVNVAIASVSWVEGAIRKNGTGVAFVRLTTGALGYPSMTNTCVTYFNGTTDYADVTIYIGTSGSLGNGVSSTFFDGVLVRSV